MRLIIHKNPEPEIFISSILNLKEKIKWIKSIADLDINTIDYINLAKQNKHICSVGFLGLSQFGAIAQYGFGIEYKKIGKILYSIFINKETATLFPVYNLTIIPFDLNPEYYLNHIHDCKKHNSIDGLGYSKEEIDYFIEDCFKSEIDYIKSGEIYFNFKDLGYDAIDYFYSVLEYVYKNKDLNLTIHLESINNIEFFEDIELSHLKTKQTTRNYRLNQINRVDTWNKIEENNKLNSWHKRGEKRKKAIQELRSINKNEREDIRNTLHEKFKSLTAVEKAKMITEDEKFPPEYYPIEWIEDILESYNIIPNSLKQELYNNLSIRVHNSKWRKLSIILKNDNKIN